MTHLEKIQSDSTSEHRPLALPANVTFYPLNSFGRDKIENFLREGFKKSFTAKTRSFMPLIMETSDNKNITTACFGIRRLEEENAFLECYLDRPVEQCINDKLCLNVDRKKIIELGSIVSSEPGAGGWLIIAATAWLKGAGYEWGVLTATNDLKKSVRKLGIELIDLAQARPDALTPEELKDWGTYYDFEPVVYATDINAAYAKVTDSPLIMKLMGGIVAYCYSLGQQRFF